MKTKNLFKTFRSVIDGTLDYYLGSEAPEAPFIIPGVTYPLSRRIAIIGAIDEKMGKEVQTAFNHMIDTAITIAPAISLKESILNKIRGKEIHTVKPVSMYINSPGGYFCDMIAIIAQMRYLQDQMQCPIAAAATGLCASAAVPILASATPGHRLATKHTRFMIHDVAGGAIGKFHDMESVIANTIIQRDNMIETMVNTTNMKEKHLRKLFRKPDHYFNAETALEYGIIDKIVENIQE